jgi:hypothetical protein
MLQVYWNSRLDTEHRRLVSLLMPGRTSACDVWRVMCDVWRVMCDVWRVMCNVWWVMCDVWQVMCNVWRVCGR